jgi:hypothetical protein
VSTQPRADDEATYDRFEMLYCDNLHCRVNTFERGPQSAGRCPGCNDPGIVVPQTRRSPL